MYTVYTIMFCYFYHLLYTSCACWLLPTCTRLFILGSKTYYEPKLHLDQTLCNRKPVTHIWH